MSFRTVIKVLPLEHVTEALEPVSNVRYKDQRQPYQFDLIILHQKVMPRSYPNWNQYDSDIHGNGVESEPSLCHINEEI